MTTSLVSFFGIAGVVFILILTVSHGLKFWRFRYIARRSASEFAFKAQKATRFLVLSSVFMVCSTSFGNIYFSGVFVLLSYFLAYMSYASSITMLVLSGNDVVLVGVSRRTKVFGFADYQAAFFEVYVYENVLYAKNSYIIYKNRVESKFDIAGYYFGCRKGNRLLRSIVVNGVSSEGVDGESVYDELVNRQALVGYCGLLIAFILQIGTLNRLGFFDFF